MAGFDPMNSTAQQYHNPTVGDAASIDRTSGGTPSTMSGQIRTDYYDRKALFETRKDRYFLPLADTTSMPKHYGKKIKKEHFMPLLDDRNSNDQGLDATGAVLADGNLYGSSRDIGKITGALPTLGENGGRVNRVGFSRIILEGTFEEFGVFYEFTQEALDFDSMENLYENMSRELINGAVQMSEAMLQIDILNGAGVERFSGAATSFGTMDGGDTLVTAGTDSVVRYEDLQRLSIQLDDNRSPKSIKMIKGSQNLDTVTVDNCRLLYVGSELIPTLTKMKDHFDNPAFVSVEHYGYSGSYQQGTGMIHGEIGKIGQFRIIVVPEMLHHAAVGAVTTGSGGNTRYRSSNDAAGDNRYDVFPMLTIGNESFTTIGFNTSGANGTTGGVNGANGFKFKTITRMPGEIVNLDDPYAKTGFTSLKFWYGFMVLRPERLAVQWTLAEL